MFLIYFLYCWKRRASLLISLWQILQLRFAMSDRQPFILLLPISFSTSALFVNRFGITSTSSAKGYYRLSILWKYFCKTLAITFSFLLRAIPRYVHFSNHLILDLDKTLATLFMLRGRLSSVNSFVFPQARVSCLAKTLATMFTFTSQAFHQCELYHESLGFLFD